MRETFKTLKSHWVGITINIIAVLINVVTMLFLPKLMANIINTGVAQGDVGFIVRTGVIMLAISVIGAGAMIISSYYSSKVAMSMGRTLRSQIFGKVQTFSLAEFDKFGTASLITRTSNDITQVETFVMMVLRIAIMSPLSLIGGIFMAYTSSSQLAHVLWVSIPALVLLIVFIAVKAMPLSKNMQKLIDRVNMVMREKLTGIRVLRAFGTEQHEEDRFDTANRDLTNTAIKMNRLMTLLMPGLLLILNFSTVAIAWIGAGQVQASVIAVGDIMAMIQYSMQILMSFMMLSFIFLIYPRASASAERIAQVLTTKQEIADVQQPVAPTLHGTVQFDNVSFAYHDAPHRALKGISFTSGPGQTTAIIGSTGSGKSTLLNLIPRFYDTAEGRVLVNGVDVKDQAMHVLRGKIGYIPQKAVLFRGSIAENIRYGKGDATQAELEQAAGIAQSATFIEEKKEGYQSPIAQGGGNLSGGQKQRLSIARAIVRAPEVYLFDDSFSALDYKTDNALRTQLATCTQQATVIIVAQRISTIRHADQIIVLEKGRMVGVGTHQQLMDSCTVYQEIVSSQLSPEEVQR